MLTTEDAIEAQVGGWAANPRDPSATLPAPGPPALTQDREHTVENAASLVARLLAVVRVAPWLTGRCHPQVGVWTAGIMRRSRRLDAEQSPEDDKSK